jgi:Uma2 family endonuclease
VLEIVSSSSLRKDKKLLREGYYRAGIREYWLVDALGDDVDFQMLEAGKDAYVAIEPNGGWLASPTFGCAFRLIRERDEIGSWQYTLHVQEKQ